MKTESGAPDPGAHPPQPCKFLDGRCTVCGEPESGMCNSGGEPAGARPVVSPSQKYRERPIQQLRDVLSMLCNYVWTKQLRPGEHMWTIPVDKERDFDCILSDAISELETRRAGEPVALPPAVSSLSSPAAGLLLTLKAECEAQHARAESAESCLTQLRALRRKVAQKAKEWKVPSTAYYVAPSGSDEASWRHALKYCADELDALLTASPEEKAP